MPFLAQRFAAPGIGSWRQSTILDRSSHWAGNWPAGRTFCKPMQLEMRSRLPRYLNHGLAGRPGGAASCARYPRDLESREREASGPVRGPLAICGVGAYGPALSWISLRGACDTLMTAARGTAVVSRTRQTDPKGCIANRVPVSAARADHVSVAWERSLLALLSAHIQKPLRSTPWPGTDSLCCARRRPLRF